ncbi:protein transport protein S31, partial [Linderina macrospora]
ATADAPWTAAPVAADGALAQPEPAAQPAAQPAQQQRQVPQAYPPIQPAAYPQTTAAGGYGTQPAYTPASMPTAQHYASPYTPGYGAAAPGYPAASAGYPSASAGYPSMTQAYAPAPPTVPSVFPPPPQPVNPSSIPSGSTPPPRREEGAWNDPPMLNKPSKRPPQSIPKPAAIVSPFPHGRATPPPASIAPFSAARSPVPQAMNAAPAPPPPRGGFVPSTKPAPPPPAASMPFPAAQHMPAQPQAQTFQPPVLQQQQQQPGFIPPAMGTVAGGPAAVPQSSRGQVVSPGATQPARIATPAKPATPKPTSKYPAGDRSHLPAEWKPVVLSLTQHLSRAKQFAAPAQKRMVDDSERRLNLLFDLMNCDEVKKKEQLAPVFQALVGELDARRFPAALHHQAELMTINSDLTTNLVGIKHLINVLKTLPM